MDIEINKIYNYLFTTDARVIVLYGGADSGKSYVVGGQYIPIMLLKKEYLRAMLIRQTYSSTKDSVFQEVMDGIQNYDFPITSTETYRKFTAPNGNTAACYGLDKISKKKSIKGINLIWVEEAEELSEKDFDNLMLRLRGGGHERIILTFNPVDEEHFSNHRFVKVERNIIEKNDDGEPKVWDIETKQTIDGEDISYKTLVIKTNWRDNKFITPQRKLSIENLKNTNPELYTILGKGDFVSLGSRIFNNWEIVQLSEEQKSIFDNIRYGIDWGFYPDPFRFLKVHVDTKKKEIYIIKEVSLTEATNTQSIEAIRPQLSQSYATITADSSEPKSITEFKNSGIRIKGAKKGADSVDFGIKQISEYKIFIDASCVETAKEFRLYKRKMDRNGNPTNTPIDAFNHSIDALRYIMEEFAKKNDQRPIHVR